MSTKVHAATDALGNLVRLLHLIERVFTELKQFRRAATRYDKRLANYEGFVQLAAIAILLR